MGALAQLPTAQVSAHAEFESTNRGSQVHLQLENKSAVLAFQVSAALRTSSGELVAPVFWSDNWVALAPGESRTLTATFSPKQMLDGQQIIQLRGWNIAPQTITATASSATH